MKKYILASIAIGSFIASSLMAINPPEGTSTTAPSAAVGAEKGKTMQVAAADDWTRETIPLLIGINFTNWLDDLWAGVPPNNRRWFNDFHESDFANAKSIGFDHIRLPIAPFANSNNDPKGTLDPVFLQRVDSAVTWAERYGLYIIIDNHQFDGNGIDASVEPLLTNAWTQLATRYKDRSDRVIYEVLNEPCNIASVLWNAIQGRIVKVIRDIDPNHYIIVGGVNYNSMGDMMGLPASSYNQYKRIIYTFHFYDPGLLTDAGMPGDFANIWYTPFPYDSSRMPACPATSLQSMFNSYPVQGTEAFLAGELDQAAAFADKNNVPVICTEYGCNRDQIYQEDRARWFETMAKLFKERNIPHASWGYKYGGFGITLVDGDNAAYPFPYNLNIDICKAMGLVLPNSITEVNSVKISPASSFVQRGKTEQLKATVTTKSGMPTECVNWSVNSANGSTISVFGTLTVSAGETASALTVTATSVWDSDGSKSATATVTLFGDVNGIEAIEGSPFTVSPNPTDGAITLKFEAAGARIITISNVEGKTLQHQTFNDQTVRLDLGNYPTGVYLLTINDGKGQTTTKIVKK